MTKLKSPGHKIRPELTRLIHDKVISLCQKRYSSFEVDGIICITLLDTKEQQVVKIHKTLKSVNAADPAESVPQTKAKKTAYPSIAAILTSNDNPPVFPSNSKSNGLADYDLDRDDPDVSSYQNDINKLSDILKETNGIESNQIKNLVEEQRERKGKRKKRHPVKVVDQTVRDIPNKDGEAGNVASNYDPYTNSAIIVKEEPVDTEYEPVNSQPNSSPPTANDKPANEKEEAENPSSIQNRFSEADDENGINNNTENSNKESGNPLPIPVSTYINSIIDERLGYSGKESDKRDSMSPNLAYPKDEGHLQLPEGSGQKHSEWLYNLAQKSLVDSGNNSGSDSGSNDSSQKSRRKRTSQGERSRQEPDPLGRSWFEMIKSNASKYQAALMRSGVPGKTGDESPKPALKDSFEHLKDLLRDRSANSEKKEGSDMQSSNTDVNKTSSADGTDLPESAFSDTDKSQSVSPVPVVKIEVDEQMQMYDINQPPTEHNGNASTLAQKTPGRLESRYPALFNQLSQSKRNATPATMDQSDSLVNRLPFISFQEIFSPSSSNASKVSDPVTRALLAKPTDNLQASKKTKTIWNWKKRHVKPKDKDGNIIAYLPARPPQDVDVTAKPLGINMSAKKTFAQKRHKSDDDDDDAEWTPSSEKKIKRNWSARNDSRGRLSTRYSSGKKQRQDFAELEMSDPEEEVDEFEEDEADDEENVGEKIELISAYCRYQCGRRFETFGDLAEHEDVCEVKDACLIDNAEATSFIDNAAATNFIDKVEGTGSIDNVEPTKSSMDNVEGGSSIDNIEVTQTGVAVHKCDICLLDFNQEYRLQYHMVKVHGVSADTDQTLFR